MGRTRNAVMGRINKDGLMGAKGSGMMSTAPIATKKAVVEAMIPDVIEVGLPDDTDTIGTLRIVLAMVADGRTSRRIRAISGQDIRDCRLVNKAMNETGIWNGRGPSPKWWETGGTAMVHDVTRIATICSVLRRSAM